MDPNRPRRRVVDKYKFDEGEVTARNGSIF